MEEEQFGPVLPIMRVKRIEDTINRANDNPNNLGSSVWSHDTEKVKRIAGKPECGSVWINSPGLIQPSSAMSRNPASDSRSARKGWKNTPIYR